VGTITSPLQINTVLDCLVVRFPQVYDCLSWAPWNGGETVASAVLNRQVESQSSCSSKTISEDFRNLCKEVSLLPDHTIGLMTVADVALYQESFLSSSGAWVHAVVTVGLCNARSVLDDADVALGSRCDSTGTVNLVVASNALPRISGRLEALHIATAAKTAAFRDAQLRSAKSDRPADVTGTDCLVVATNGEIKEDACGLHTILGEMIGRAVYMTVSRGIAKLLRTAIV